MLLLIGAGLLTGVIIGNKIIKNKIIENKITKESINQEKKLSNKANILYNYKKTVLNNLTQITKLIDSVPYILYKRIHSITGIFFIGGFVVAHFINNSLAYNPKKLNELSESIHKNPLFPLVEITLIYIPLTLHMVIGSILLFKGKIDTRIKSETNYRYILQKLSAYIIMKTLLFHLLTIRFNEYLPKKFRELFNIPDKRDLTYQKVNVWFKKPLSLFGKLTYYSFVTSVAYHLSNGIWTSAITWGLAKTYERQVKLRKLSNIIFIGLTIWGYIIIYLYSKEYNKHD